MKNITLIAVSALLIAMVCFAYFSEKRYRALNDEFWLAKVDHYLLLTDWLDALESVDLTTDNTTEAGQRVNQAMQQNIDQERILIDLCLAEKCVSQRALRLMNNMLTHGR